MCFSHLLGPLRTIILPTSQQTYTKWSWTALFLGPIFHQFSFGRCHLYTILFTNGDSYVPHLVWWVTVQLSLFVASVVFKQEIEFLFVTEVVVSISFDFQVAEFGHPSLGGYVFVRCPSAIVPEILMHIDYTGKLTINERQFWILQYLCCLRIANLS